MAIDAKFRKFREYAQAGNDRLQTSLVEEEARANATVSERVKLLVSEKGFNRQLQLRSEDMQEVEYFKYLLDGAVAKKCRSHTVIESIQEQPLSAPTDFDKYRQRLPVYTERFMADVADGCSGFLYNLRTEVKRLAEKQCKKFDDCKKILEAIAAFSRDVDISLGRPRPSS